MRIIAGDKKRMRLIAPPGLETRPTLDRVRESLFMMLEGGLAGARVLDLYAGAGTLGLEALSRGAAEAVFVETSRAALGALRGNIDRLKLAAQSKIAAADAGRLLARRERVGPLAGPPFDLILADPPYGQGLAASALELIGRQCGLWLAPEGTLVIQLGAREDLPAECGALERASSRRYGDTRVDIFRRAEQRGAEPERDGGAAESSPPE